MTLDIEHLSPGKKIFFASDFHLGAPDREESLNREKKIVTWLESTRNEAEMIILAGDLFDFWFEFGHVIPKGYTRLQGKLAELSDAGIRIIVFPGNHDRWMFRYFQNEIGITIFLKPQSFSVNGKKFYVAHGDGLGPGDLGYKLLNNLMFRNKLLQFFFKWMIPNIGMWLGLTWSRASFRNEEIVHKKFYGEKEWLIQYSKEVESNQHHDYYIFGHRHLSYFLPISENSYCVNLGEWIRECSFAVFDGKELKIEKFEDNKIFG